jgi:hypothetical protein
MSQALEKFCANLSHRRRPAAHLFQAHPLAHPVQVRPGRIAAQAHGRVLVRVNLAQALQAIAGRV